MMDLSESEQREINDAVQDIDGWALPNGTPPDLLEGLVKKGMIRFWANRWQLTPVGFARSKMFR